MKKLLLSMGLLLSITMNAQIPSYVPTDNLMAYYPFSGNANDVSGNGHNGTVHSAIPTTDRSENKNSAYSFDGASNYITAAIYGSLPLNNSQRTVAGWFKADSNNGNFSRIFSYGKVGEDFQEFSLGISPTGGYLIFYYTENNWVASKKNYLDNKWHFFAITASKTTVSLYVDGVFVATQDVVLQTAWSVFKIGDRASGSGDYFKGTIDDIGIWNTDLGANKIMALYNSYNLGVSNPNYYDTVTIYPNPTKDHITIDFGNISDVKGASIKIYNELGQQVFSDIMNTQTYNLSLGSWGKGVYFIKIYDADNIELNAKKFILQ